VRIAYLVVAATLIGTWLVELARGYSGSPYDWLALVAAGSYLVAAVVVRVLR